jgi:peptide chain release factor 2
MELQELRKNCLIIYEQLNSIRNNIKYDEIENEIKIFNKESQKKDFWNDPQKAQNILKKINIKKKLKEDFDSLYLNITSEQDIIELLIEEFDEATFKDLEKEFTELEKEFQIFKIKTTFTEENDNKNAIMTIKPGAGGTEAQDWALMLLRMYTRWAEKHGAKIDTLEFMSGDEAGIKVATIQISTNYAYGYLKGEIGIHRLVRISPFDSNARRHTSFASVYVIPEVDNDIKLDINEKDIRIDTFHSSGPGGQSVNTTDSAVRITHLPTGIFATCQVERSQLKNKEKAMKLLMSRLYEHYKEIQEAEKANKAVEKKDISWGHQIRSYVFQPYTMVKDLRTGVETGNIQGVMDGNIDPFIEGFLLYEKK